MRGRPFRPAGRKSSAFSAAVKAAEIALEGVREEEANVGSRTVLDVLDAEQELLDARVGLVRAMRDELVATYQLRQADRGSDGRKARDCPSNCITWKSTTAPCAENGGGCVRERRQMTLTIVCTVCPQPLVSLFNIG